MRVVKQWNRLLREVMESPFLELLKNRVDMAMSNMLLLTLFLTPLVRIYI